VKRKPIQIAVTGVENTASTQCNWIAIALCDDGTIWCNSDFGPWNQLNDIPQPAPAEEPASEPGCLCGQINARHCPVHQEPQPDREKEMVDSVIRRTDALDAEGKLGEPLPDERTCENCYQLCGKHDQTPCKDWKDAP